MVLTLYTDSFNRISNMYSWSLLQYYYHKCSQVPCYLCHLQMPYVGCQWFRGGWNLEFQGRHGKLEYFFPSGICGCQLFSLPWEHCSWYQAGSVQSHSNVWSGHTGKTWPYSGEVHAFKGNSPQILWEMHATGIQTQNSRPVYIPSLVIDISQSIGIGSICF